MNAIRLTCRVNLWMILNCSSCSRPLAVIRNKGRGQSHGERIRKAINSVTLQPDDVAFDRTEMILPKNGIAIFRFFFLHADILSHRCF